MNVLIIALGGALGALTRYGLGIWVSSRWGHSFPLGTFIINISGAFVLGLINVFAVERTILSPAWRLGLGIGFLGAYTTFSTFTYETIVLIEEGSYLVALGYALGSTVTGLLAAFFGTWVARML